MFLCIIRDVVSPSALEWCVELQLTSASLTAIRHLISCYPIERCLYDVNCGDVWFAGKYLGHFSQPWDMSSTFRLLLGNRMRCGFHMCYLTWWLIFDVRDLFGCHKVSKHIVCSTAMK